MPSGRLTGDDLPGGVSRYHRIVTVRVVNLSACRRRNPYPNPNPCVLRGSPIVHRCSIGKVSRFSIQRGDYDAPRSSGRSGRPGRDRFPSTVNNAGPGCFSRAIVQLIRTALSFLSNQSTCSPKTVYRSDNRVPRNTIETPCTRNPPKTGRGLQKFRGRVYFASG